VSSSLYVFSKYFKKEDSLPVWIVLIIKGKDLMYYFKNIDLFFKDSNTQTLNIFVLEITSIAVNW